MRMEAERFDTLTRTLAIPASRRKVFQALAASAAGTFLFRTQDNSAVAQTGAACTVTSDCVTDQPCAGFQCVDGACAYGVAECGMFNPAITCCLDVEAGKVTCCGEDESCVEGTCQGPCGEGCAYGEVCVAGMCTPACTQDSDCQSQECQVEGHCQPEGTCLYVEVDSCFGAEDDGVANDETEEVDEVVTILPNTGRGGLKTEMEGKGLRPLALVGASAAVVARGLRQGHRLRRN
jgi:hypothetical protein